MVVIYPEHFLYPNCQAAIRLDYSKDKAQTADMMAMRVDISQSQKSGSDARKYLTQSISQSDFEILLDYYLISTLLTLS